MRYGLSLIAFAFLIGCGTSQPNQPTSETPSVPAADSDSTEGTPAENTPAVADGDAKPGAFTAQQLESTSLEEIQKRIDDNVNDRAAWDMYIAKVAQTAKASLESDPFESSTIIEQGLRFCLKHNYDMDDDVRTEVFAQTETVWDPISEEAGKRLEAEAGVDPEE